LSRSPVDDGASERPGSGSEGREFPDPTVIRVGSTYYAYGTGGSFHQIMRSTDLVNWDWLGTAMRSKPEWVVAAEDWHAWAPSVLPTQEACPGASEPGCFILYYVGLSDRYGTAMTNCVGVATSSRPEGPFTDRGPLEREDGLREGRWPVGCGDAAGYGNIDPQPFVDADGRTWLYVSTDWRCTDTCRLLPEISAIPLSTDRLRAAGARQPLLAGQKDTWEQAPWAPVIENPYVVKRGDTYHLLYSGGNWQDRYAMGHATAPTATGPFTRSSTNPWTGGTDSVLSMGGGMPFRDGAGDEWLVYHGRDGSLAQPRTLRIDRLSWTDERPRLDGPSTGARAAPTP
jgi:beta-xylosidase